MTDPGPQTQTGPLALVRPPGPGFDKALSTHSQKHSIDLDRARDQHRAYVDALIQAGARIKQLPPVNQCPDATFVEDTAIVFSHGAVLCPMKEKSRRGEIASVAAELKNHLPLHSLSGPATLDGGDVLDTDSMLFVGLSRRTNREGAHALSRLAEKPVTTVRVIQGLHLKSAVSYLGNGRVVIDCQSVDSSCFKELHRIRVEPKERYAANCLKLGQTVLMAAGYPDLAGKIRGEGFKVVELDMSEFEKADGGITCLSLIIPEAPV